ncbi:MAG: Crp/Fnr family transcriptional regulator [Maritimibacter harenae]
MQTSIKDGRVTTSACANCQSRGLGFCSLLTGESRKRFAAATYRSRYVQGAEIAAQDEPNDRIGIVASGLVKNVVITENGDEHLIQIVKPGQFVGDPNRETNSFSSEAAIPAEVCWIPRPAWLAYLNESPAHFQAFVATLADQFEATRQTVIKMRGRNTTQRVALWLLEQVPLATGGRETVVHIPLTRRDLASLLDMTVETLCRALHQLDTRGAITLLAPDVVEVTNMARLRTQAKWHDDRVQQTLARPAFQALGGARRNWSDLSATDAGRDHSLSAPRPRAVVGGDRRQ